MQYFLLLSLAASAICDGGDHHHQHDQYSVPQADPAPSYGAPAQDTYGAPQEAPIYSAPAQSYAPAPQEYGAPAQQEYAPQEYGAPAQEYAPAAEYGAPAQAEYGAPAQEYGAPAQEYAAQPEYAAPTGYEAPQEYAPAAIGGDLFDLSKISELLPLFIAVFGAIIVSQIFAPLLAGLFGQKVAFLSTLFAPLSTAKVSLINTILAPFNLGLCDITNVATPVLATGRNSASGFQMNSDTVDMVANMLYKALDNYSQ